MIESYCEEQEFQLFCAREICYWTANNNPNRKDVLPREKIMTLPSEKEAVERVKRYHMEYAERFMKSRSKK